MARKKKELTQDEYFMKEAIRQAKKSAETGLLEKIKNAVEGSELNDGTEEDL